jgi:hypothetical protein
MAQAASLPPVSLIPADQPVMPRQARQGDRQHHLARPLRPAIRLLSLFQALELAADIDQHAGDFRTDGVKRPMTLSLAAMTSSRSAAAFDGEPRRDRSEGASADQFAVTRGLR